MDKKRLLTLTVNGDVYDIVCAPNVTLLDALREKANPHRHQARLRRGRLRRLHRAARR